MKWIMKLKQKVLLLSLRVGAFLGSGLVFASTPANLTPTPQPICQSTTSSSSSTTPSGPDDCTFASLFQNIGIASSSVIQIAYVVSIVLGVAVVIYGLIKLRSHALDSQGSSGSIRHAVYAFVVGGCFISIPTITLLILGTFYGTSVPMVDQNNVLDYGQSSTQP